MGDPICKWRNASTWTVVELVEQLPKKSMPNFEFRDYMEKHSIYHKSFTKTVYQLACQLGLYYISDDDRFIPRFTKNINLIQAKDYMEKWVKRYYVPNPYTARRFDSFNEPVILENAISNFVSEHPKITDLTTICNFIFGEETGNILCVKFFINQYSKLVNVNKENQVYLLSDEEIELYCSGKNRYDKKEFFETFND